MSRKLKFKKYLKKSGLKPYQFANAIGMSTSVIYDWLNGKRDIQLQTWERIEKVINQAK